MKSPGIRQRPLSVMCGILCIAYMGWSWPPLFVNGFPILATGLSFDPSDSNHEHYTAGTSTTPMATTKSEAKPHSQGISAGTWTKNDTDGTLEEQLKDDQMALQRMVLILALVGGLGAVAVVVTGVMFIRIRRWKQRTNNKFGSSNPTDDRHTLVRMNLFCRYQHSTSIGQSNVDESSRSTQYSSARTDEYSSSSSTTNDERRDPSSAAPAVITASCRHRHRQFLPITSPQGTPEPSAPSAKELTSYDTTATNMTCTLCDMDEEQGQHGLFRDHGLTGLDKPTAIAPEVPPPAYSPSAPPLYDR